MNLIKNFLIKMKLKKLNLKNFYNLLQIIITYYKKKKFSIIYKKFIKKSKKIQKKKYNIIVNFNLLI